jgi:hypothetical protein
LLPPLCFKPGLNLACRLPRRCRSIGRNCRIQSLITVSVVGARFVALEARMMGIEARMTALEEWGTDVTRRLYR